MLLFLNTVTPPDSFSADTSLSLITLSKVLFEASMVLALNKTHKYFCETLAFLLYPCTLMSSQLVSTPSPCPLLTLASPDWYKYHAGWA